MEVEKIQSIIESMLFAAGRMVSIEEIELALEISRVDLEKILEQVIDNQFILNKKIDTVIDLLGKLTNTIIKYDNEYQQQIANDAGKG